MTSKKFLADATGAAMIVIVITLLASGPRAYCQVPATYFGMDLNERVAQQPPPQSGNPWPVVPIGSLRLWDAGVGWAQINTAQGVYDWTLLDEWLQDVQTFNVQAVMYTFGMTPQWASSHPNDTTCAWGPGECDPPKDLNPMAAGPIRSGKTTLQRLPAALLVVSSTGRSGMSPRMPTTGMALWLNWCGWPRTRAKSF